MASKVHKDFKKHSDSYKIKHCKKHNKKGGVQ